MSAFGDDQGIEQKDIIGVGVYVIYRGKFLLRKNWRVLVGRVRPGGVYRLFGQDGAGQGSGAFHGAQGHQVAARSDGKAACRAYSGEFFPSLISSWGTHKQDMKGLR